MIDLLRIGWCADWNRCRGHIFTIASLFFVADLVSNTRKILIDEKSIEKYHLRIAIVLCFESDFVLKQNSRCYDLYSISTISWASKHRRVWLTHSTTVFVKCSFFAFATQTTTYLSACLRCQFCAYACELGWDALWLHFCWGVRSWTLSPYKGVSVHLDFHYTFWIRLNWSWFARFAA